VTGQLHALAALLPRKEPLVPIGLEAHMEQEALLTFHRLDPVACSQRKLIMNS